MKKSIALLLAFVLVFCGNILVLADTTQEQVWDTGSDHNITITVPQGDPANLDVQNKWFTLKTNLQIDHDNVSFISLDGAKDGILQYANQNEVSKDGFFITTFRVGAKSSEGFTNLNKGDYKYELALPFKDSDIEPYKIPVTLKIVDTPVIYIVSQGTNDLWGVDGKTPLQVGKDIKLDAIISISVDGENPDKNYEIKWYVDGDNAKITESTDTKQFNGSAKWVGSSATITGVSSESYVTFGAKLFIDGKEVNSWNLEQIPIVPSADGTPEKNYWKFPDDGEYVYGEAESTYMNEYLNNFYGDEDDLVTLDSPSLIKNITFSGTNPECFRAIVETVVQTKNGYRSRIQFEKNLPSQEPKVYEANGTITFESGEELKFFCWVEVLQDFAPELRWNDDVDEPNLYIEQGREIITEVTDNGAPAEYTYRWVIQSGQECAGFTSVKGAKNCYVVEHGPTTSKTDTLYVYGYAKGNVAIYCEVNGPIPNGQNISWRIKENFDVIAKEDNADLSELDNIVENIKKGTDSTISVPSNESISADQFKALKAAAEKSGSNTTITLKSGNNDNITMSFNTEDLKKSSDADIEKMNGKFTPLFTPVIPPEVAASGLLPTSTGKWVTFAYSGDLPVPMTIRMKIGSDFPKNEEIILWRYLDNSNEIRVEKMGIPVDTISEPGYAIFTLTHFSTYAIYPASVMPNQSKPSVGYRPQSSSSSGSSGGGGSSSSSSSVSKRLLNSSALDNINVANHTATAKTVSVTDATSVANKAADQAKAGGKTRSYVRFVNPAAISKVALDAIQKVSSQKGIQLSVYADTIVNNVIVSRMYIDPATYTLSTDLKTSVITNVPTVKAHFNKYFKNKLQVVGFTQQGPLGTNIAAAVKLDFNGMDTSKLILYSYDAVQNRYSILSDQTYFIDVNGYLHFTTSEGNYIIVSEGQLR